MTHKENVMKALGLPKDTHLSKEELAAKLNIPVAALHESYDRGIGAWKNNISSVRLLKDFSKNYNTAQYPRSARLPKEMWAMARVYSFVNRGKTFYTADADIARKYDLV